MATTWAIDIDGTITENGNGTVHLGALSALRDLAAAGHQIIYVTGRSSVEAYILGVFGGTGTVSVGENGGCITTDASTHIMLGDMASCRRALELLKHKIPQIREKPVFPRMTEVVLERNIPYHTIRDTIQGTELDVAVSDSGYAIHINSKGIDKGVGLQRVMDMYDIPRRDVIAVGDGRNDIAMFRAAGFSAALGNAPREVKDAADTTAACHRGPGLIEIVRRFQSGDIP